MGYTQQTVDRIERHLDGVKHVLDLGSSNMYLNGEEFPPFASEWYREKGIGYTAIDLAGDNGALQWDLGRPIKFLESYDLLVDAGVSEHICKMKSYESVAFHGGHINSIYPTEIESEIEGFYNGWMNKHNALKVGAVMVNENPLSGDWPGHGYHYITEEFYRRLIEVADYEILELGIECAMGNCETGKNVVSVLRKIGPAFPSFKTFQELPIYKS